MNLIGGKLKKLRKKRGIKRGDAAKAAGISYDYLAKIENGRRSPNLSVLERVAGAVGATIGEVLSEKPAPTHAIGSLSRQDETAQRAPSGQAAPLRSPFMPDEWGLIRLGAARPVPRIGWARAGAWDEASDGGFEPGAADEWVYTDAGGGRAFSLRVEGDSMEPEFFEGETIIVDPERRPKSGDFVIAKFESENKATFKQLKYLQNRPVLHPLNPKYPDIEVGDGEGARIVGVVVEKKTFFGEPDERELKLTGIFDRIAGLNIKELERVIKALDLLFGQA